MPVIMDTLPAPTNTPTATATLPPSPTPTESPEEAAARLAQDVLDGNITDLSGLDEQQRSAVFEILDEHIPELAAMVIQNQNRYAGLVLPLPEEAQRAIHLEIAAQINANKLFNPTHTNGSGVKIGFYEGGNTWFVREIPSDPSLSGKELKLLNPADFDPQPKPIQVFVAGRTVFDTSGNVVGYEMHDQESGNWVPLDLTGLVQFPRMTDLSVGNELSEKWKKELASKEGIKIQSIREKKDKTSIVMPAVVIDGFEDSLPIPNSMGGIYPDGRWICYPFRSVSAGFPVFEGDNLLGLVKIRFFVDPYDSFVVETPSKASIFNSVTSADQAKRMPKWDPEAGKLLLFMTTDHAAFSKSSYNPVDNEPFPKEMISLETFLKTCPIEGECSLQTLADMRGWLAFGVGHFAEIGK
ncbi:MAG: hypothetical protein KG029_08615 [Bacteroidetes bacterium]|nr:hypothetical protein [Bacteroidota bacterium]